MEALFDKRIRKLKIREGSRDPKKWREDAQNLTLLMDYLRLLQPPGVLLKTLRGKEQHATYRLFANALHFVLSGLTRARAKEVEAWDNDEGKAWTTEFKVHIAYCVTPTRLCAVSFVRILRSPPSRTQKQLNDKEEQGDLGERAMRSVIAAAVSLLCAKDNEEDVETKAELNRSRDENPETEYGQRMGDIANIVLPKVIELLTEDQHERFSRHRIIRTPEMKV